MTEETLEKLCFQCFSQVDCVDETIDVSLAEAQNAARVGVARNYLLLSGSKRLSRSSSLCRSNRYLFLNGRCVHAVAVLRHEEGWEYDYSAIEATNISNHCKDSVHLPFHLISGVREFNQCFHL